MCSLKDMQTFMNNVGKNKAELSIQQRYGYIHNFCTFARTSKNKHKLGNILRRRGKQLLQNEFEYWREKSND